MKMKKRIIIFTLSFLVDFIYCKYFTDCDYNKLYNKCKNIIELNKNNKNVINCINKYGYNIFRIEENNENYNMKNKRSKCKKINNIESINRIKDLNILHSCLIIEE